MPMSYRIDSAAGLVHVMSVDRIAASEMQDLAHALLADADFRPGMNVLSDTRRLKHAPSTDDIRVASGLVERVSGAGVKRVAIVATSAVVYGMLSMLGALTADRGAELQVFTRPDEALAWLAESRSS